MTTHVALTARALGADEVWVDREDRDLEARVADVVDRFGGPFSWQTGVAWRRAVKAWEGLVVHLTMYGEPLEGALMQIPKDRDLLVIVGSQKVPGEVFEAADYNVAIGNQPHSEVAALAVFLDRYLDGKGLGKDFQGLLEVRPSARGKVVDVGPTRDPPD